MADPNPSVQKVRSWWFIIIIATAVAVAFNLPKIIARLGGGPALGSGSAVQEPLATEATDLLSYQNQADGYAFSYPASWVKQEGALQTSVLFITGADPGDNPASLSAVKIKLDAHMPLYDFSDGTLRQLKQDFPDLTIFKSERTQWAGQNGFRVVYAATTNQRLIKTAQTWMVRNNIIYIIGFGGSPESYEKYQAAAEKVMASFRFL